MSCNRNRAVVELAVSTGARAPRVCAPPVLTCREIRLHTGLPPGDPATSRLAFLRQLLHQARHDVLTLPPVTINRPAASVPAQDSGAGTPPRLSPDFRRLWGAYHRQLRRHPRWHRVNAITLSALAAALAGPDAARATPPGDHVEGDCAVAAERFRRRQKDPARVTRDASPHWITVSGSCDTREQVLKRDH